MSTGHLVSKDRFGPRMARNEAKSAKPAGVARLLLYQHPRRIERLLSWLKIGFADVAVQTSVRGLDACSRHCSIISDSPGSRSASPLRVRRTHQAGAVTIRY